MSPEFLLAQFEQVSHAPDAVARLRRFILDLAVRGMLVPQDPSEEAAVDQLERIAAAKLRRGRTARSTKPRNGQSATEEPEIVLPAGWARAPLSELVTVLNGRAYRKKEFLDAGTPVLRVGNLFTSSTWYYSNLELEDDKYCDNGDLIFAWSASFGPFIWTGGKVIYHYHIWKLALHSESDLDKLFVYSLLLQKAREIKAAGHGVSMIHMTKEKMEKIVVPLPPLAEQHRIVAKVDELMALCDELEAAQAKRQTRRDRLVAATLHGLNNGDSDAGSTEAFQQTARFYFNHLPRLTTKPEHIHQLRQTILNLAVRGKLVPQDPKDEPAARLLERIEDERSVLLSSGVPNEAEARTQQKKQHKQKLPGDLDQLPPGWEWATLMQCSNLVVDCHNKTAPYVESGVPLLRTSNIRFGKLVWENLRYVSEATFDRWSARCEPSPGDILITREAPMGEVATIPTGMRVCMGQRLMLVRLGDGTIDPEFLLYSLRDPSLMSRVQDKPVGATVQHLRVGGVESLLVQVPPLAEQRHIVTKVDELMALCDELEIRLADASNTRRALLETTLREALLGGKQ